jgi:hydroxymethylpyrimidine pyrophosphatase-like HAD family hydrolase
MNFIIDIDDTIFKYPDKEYKDIIDKYNSAIVDEEMRKDINKLYGKGQTIILFTGRNWDKYDFTKQQLADFNICYNILIMGKPQGIYIDKYSYKTLKEFFKNV